MQKIPVTAEGFRRMEEELRHLKGVERPAIVKAISEAREHGDLSENAEYSAARERQSFNEGRIADLEARIGRAEVIEVSQLSGDTVTFGAIVTVIDEDSEEETTYQIVGDWEADLKSGKIAINAPISRALIGKKKGDSVEVQTPKGIRFYEITNIRFV